MTTLKELPSYFRTALQASSRHFSVPHILKTFGLLSAEPFFWSGVNRGLRSLLGIGFKTCRDNTLFCDARSPISEPTALCTRQDASIEQELKLQDTDQESIQINTPKLNFPELLLGVVDSSSKRPGYDVKRQRFGELFYSNPKKSSNTVSLRS
jgi:hypothetical protein